MESYPTFNVRTTAEEAAAALANEIKGKNVLITGTTINSLGFESARAIAQHAGLVVLAGYNTERLKLSEEAIKKEYPSANIRTLILDLASFTGVRKAASEVLAYKEPLHVIMHYALADVGPYKLSADHVELQFAVAHASPFLFTALVAPKLLSAQFESQPAKVVLVASAAHRRANSASVYTYEALTQPATAGTLTGPGASDPIPYTSIDAYARVKAANVLFGKELTRRSGGSIEGFSLHPGVVNTTIPERPETLKTLQQFGIFTEEGHPNTKDHQWNTRGEGGATAVVAAFDPRLQGKGGTYLTACAPAEIHGIAVDSDGVVGKALWEVSERLVGEKFVL
ncbi:hypothetical protein C8F01DRAFT_1254533 [Mycena amicta]|nr:hypothetical protein C8F01DRAFT_1254533 [Mycena amicta]